VDATEEGAILFKVEEEDDIFSDNEVWYLYENHICQFKNFWNAGNVCPEDPYNINYSKVYSCSKGMGGDEITEIARSIEFYCRRDAPDAVANPRLAEFVKEDGTLDDGNEDFKTLLAQQQSKGKVSVQQRGAGLHAAGEKKN
jgi:hypothetical protein